MHIDKYKKDGGYFDEDDVYHGDDAIGFYMSYIFGFCGCGAPEACLLHIYKYLKLINENKYYNEHENIEESGMKYFIYYWFDKIHL